MDNGRHERIVVTVTAEEKEKIVESAANLGMPVTAYCRYVLLFKKEEE